MFKLFCFIMLLSLMFFTSNCANAQQTDPTRPLSGTSRLGTINSISEFKLQSIIQTDNQIKALINGSLLKVGDTIGQYTIVEINKKNVEMKSSFKNLKLSLFSDVVSNKNEKK